MREAVYAALCAMRPSFAPTEEDLHRAVSLCLEQAGFPFTHEAPLAPGCRIDFLCGDVGIEIKKGRPARAELIRQLARYARSERVSALIVIAPRMGPLPAAVGGKPVRGIALDRLWGVALP